ncbi:tryptophan synthase subunit alpha [Enterococcus nangangensis]|uniref:tryptophan synthase subunit alpha n=1 Tax=Enterococcus nangangensis TaxID=2559926 RepID=UPI0010F6E13C|nr:tryptophan synthase subunit alpha [Enterococcus nangangensis]
MKTLTHILQTKKAQGEKLFVPYMMAGANGLENLGAEITALAAAGASAIEIGVPFSDPVADGPVIQLAGLAALANGVSLKKIVAALQTIDASVPLILMGYANSFFHYGLEQLAEDLKDTSVKGAIIPDLPYEHRNFVLPTFEQYDLALIQLVSLTSPHARIATLVQEAEGFVYAVTINGTTGTGKTYQNNLDDHLKEIIALAPVPVLAGFGVSTPQHVARFNQCCDGVVVGSKIVATLQKEGLAATANLVRQLTGRLESKD